MLAPSTKTLYAAARGDQILSDGYDKPETAQQQAQHLNEQMEALSLTGDVTVVEVLVTTKLGRAKPYRDHVEVPVTATVETTNPEDGNPTDQTEAP